MLYAQITAWLQSRGKPFHPEDFATVQVADQPESIGRWSESLGARPTVADLAPFKNPGPGPVAIRAERDRLLKASDWTMLPDAPLTVAQRALWAVYRHGLREITRQPTFPASVVWPASPGQ